MLLVAANQTLVLIHAPVLAAGQCLRLGPTDRLYGKYLQERVSSRAGTAAAILNIDATISSRKPGCVPPPFHMFTSMLRPLVVPALRAKIEPGPAFSAQDPSGLH